MAAKAKPLITEEQMARAADALMSGLPKSAILARYVAAGGDEIGSGNFASPESSAALVANAFGFFIDRPADLPAIPDWKGAWCPHSVLPEVELRFPWSGGMHPWLDVVIETDDVLIGVEAKRYEPFRPHSTNEAPFSTAYKRPVWGDQMGPYLRMRDELSEHPQLFARLNAVQLVKHAFGLYTQAHRGGTNKKPVLAYVYAEPKICPPSVTKAITEEDRKHHAKEVREFQAAVTDADVCFMTFTYSDLLATFEQSAVSAVREHGRAMRERFDC